MTTIDYWDKNIEEYSNRYDPTEQRLGYEILEELLGDVRDKKILDYGCGPGKFTKVLRNKGAYVYGLDLSLNAIKKAKKGNIFNAQFYEVNEGISMLKDNTIDFSISTFVLCTIKKEDEILNILKNIYSKLRKGGSLFILDAHPNSLGKEYISLKRDKPLRLFSGAPINVVLNGMEKPLQDYWRSIEDYKNFLNKVGFEVLEIVEPLIKEDKEGFWKDETKFPPTLIIKAIKR